MILTCVAFSVTLISVQHQTSSSLKILCQINWSVVIWAGIYTVLAHLILFPSVRWKWFQAQTGILYLAFDMKVWAPNVCCSRKLAWVWEEADNIKSLEGNSFEIQSPKYWSPSGGSTAVATFCFPADTRLCLQNMFLLCFSWVNRSVTSE